MKDEEMKSILLKRRTEFLGMIAKGAPLREVIEELSKKYGVTQDTLYRDWNRRSLWLSQIMQLSDKSTLYEILVGFKEALAQCWLRYLTSPNENIRLGALKLIVEVYSKQIDLLLRLGLTPKAVTPELAEEMPWESIPEFRERIQQIREQSKKESTIRNNHVL